MLTARRAAATLLTTVLALAVLVSPAHAAECVSVTDRWGLVTVDCSVRPGGGGGGGTSPVSDGGSVECTRAGKVVPCTSEFGTWDGTCYVQVADPQPPADPMFPGHTFVWCTVPGAVDVVRVGAWREYVPGVVGPSARELADRAVARMQLTTGTIGTTPPSTDDKPDSRGIIGLPIWLWISNPAPNTTGPITETATGAGITVTATATLDRVEWTMRDRTPGLGAPIVAAVTCQGEAAPGTPYHPDYGLRDSSCQIPPAQNAHAGQYTITGTAHWTVTWTGAGQTGTIAVTAPSRSVPLTITELQALIVK